MSLTEAKKALAALEKKSSVFCATSAFLLDVNAVDIVDRLEGCSRWALCSCPCSLIASEHLTNGKSAESLALLGLMHLKSTPPCFDKVQRCVCFGVH